MTMAAGFMLGAAFCWLLVHWGALWRQCCRQHYETHGACSCRDCAREREEESRA